MHIDAAWDIIERVLHDRLPAVAETLRGPVSDEDLSRLASTTAQELPEDFIASLRRHDGQSNPTRLLDLFDHYTLLNADAMIDNSDMRADALGDDLEDTIEWMTPEKVRPIMNCRGWLQFAEAEGDGFALDLAPLPAGTSGQIISLPVDGPTPTPEFPSYGAWLSSYAEKLDAGAFRIDETLGLWLDH
jgi:cell wall assembly regulator SMI1